MPMLPPFDPWCSAAVAADVAADTHANAHALAARRDRRLGTLLTSAARGPTLYRRLLKRRDPASTCLQDLPIMRKAELMHRFGDWVSDPDLQLDALRRFVAEPAHIAEPFLGRYMVWESSGSGGEPGVFVQDASAMAVYDALEALRRPLLRPLQRLFDPWSLAEQTVFVGAIGGHFASTVSIERLRRLNPTLARRLHSVNFLQSTPQLVAEINALAPAVLATYPSVAVLLAQEHRDGRLRVAPQEVWTGGETLSMAMRTFVRQTFGCALADSYGASEFLSMACECRCGGLHLNSDWVVLESVDDRGHPMPPDEAGATTLLTNLANHVQPLIRYDLGDRVTLRAKACECGSSLPLIEVQGRSGDTLWLGRPDAKAVSVLPLALSTVLEEEAGLYDFQLVQQGPCALLLRTGLHGDAARSTLRRARTALVAFLARQGAPGVQVHCRSGEPGQCCRSGKVQRVVASLS
ncbi:MAG: phenylacetate--CoA ligase family protein [Methylibium sp.]|nr:phenylacetate--CoA ligase family protein [Methylibium sp.]